MVARSDAKLVKKAHMISFLGGRQFGGIIGRELLHLSHMIWTLKTTVLMGEHALVSKEN